MNINPLTDPIPQSLLQYIFSKSILCVINHHECDSAHFKVPCFSPPPLIGKEHFEGSSLNEISWTNQTSFQTSYNSSETSSSQVIMVYWLHQDNGQKLRNKFFIWDEIFLSDDSIHFLSILPIYLSFGTKLCCQRLWNGERLVCSLHTSNKFLLLLLKIKIFII